MKHKRHYFFITICMIVLLSACGGGGQESAKPTQQATPLDMSTVGTISGVIRFEGTVPEQSVAQLSGWAECASQHPQGNPPAGDVVVNDRRVQNALVYIKDGLGNRVFATPAEPVSIDQKGCLFLPRVVGVQVDQPLKFLNSDALAHNVHGFAQTAKPWNVSLSVKGMTRAVKVDKPEAVIEVKCDIHPWMRAYVGAFLHPYFAVSGSDGTFILRNLPPGEYTLEAWHERFGIRSQKVSLGAKEAKEVEVKFGAS
jgi:plastocyanin